MNRKVILLVALVLGLAGAVVLGLAVSSETNAEFRAVTVVSRSIFDGDPELEAMVVAAMEELDGMDIGTLRQTYVRIAEEAGISIFRPAFIAWLITSLLATLAAVALNLLGWLKNSAPKTLIAAILYLVSLNIPAAVLCFIGRKKINS